MLRLFAEFDSIQSIPHGTLQASQAQRTNKAGVNFLQPTMPRQAQAHHNVVATFPVPMWWNISCTRSIKRRRLPATSIMSTNPSIMDICRIPLLQEIWQKCCAAPGKPILFAVLSPVAKHRKQFFPVLESYRLQSSKNIRFCDSMAMLQKRNLVLVNSTALLQVKLSRTLNRPGKTDLFCQSAVLYCP